MHHRDAVDLELDRRLDERPDGVVGRAGPGVAQHVGLPGCEPEGLVHIDAAVHAGEDGEPAGGDRSQIASVELGGVLGVALEQIFEVLHDGSLEDPLRCVNRSTVKGADRTIDALQTPAGIHRRSGRAWHRSHMDDEPSPPSSAGTPAASEAAATMPPWLPRAMMLFFGGVVLLLAGEWLLVRLSSLILMLVVSLFLSFALEPAVDWLAQRGWRRGSATGLVLSVLFIGTVLFLGAIGKLVVDQVSQFIDQAPNKAQSIEDWANRTFGTSLSSDKIAEEFNNPDGPIRTFATKLAGNALGFSISALGVVFQFFTILLFTFYLVADGPRFRRTICSFLRPDRQREVLANWEIAIQKTGGYIYSRLLLGGLSAMFHYVAFVIIGVPYAIALALFVGLVSQFVPVVGTYIAGALPTLIALAVNPVDAVWVLGFALVCGMPPQTVWAGEKVSIKLGHVLDTKHPYHIGAEHFANRVRELTNGRVEVQVFPSSQLGGEREMAEAIQFGTLESAAIMAAVAGRFVREFDIFNLPFLFRDFAHVYKVLDGPFGEELNQASIKKGFRVLGIYVGGSRSVYARKPISDLASLKGMKIRQQLVHALDGGLDDPVLPD